MWLRVCVLIFRFLFLADSFVISSHILGFFFFRDLPVLSLLVTRLHVSLSHFL